MARLRIVKRSFLEQSIAADGMGLFLYYADGSIVLRDDTDPNNPIPEFFAALNTLLIPDPLDFERNGKWGFTPATTATGAEMPPQPWYVQSGMPGMGFSYVAYTGTNYSGPLDELYVLTGQGTYAQIKSLGLAPAQAAQAAKLKESVSGFEVDPIEIGLSLNSSGEPVTAYTPNEIVNRIKILKMRYDNRNGNTVEDIL